MHKDLTLWVPTKNRPQFLYRLLEYYKQTNFKGYLYIGDSSEGVSKDINIKNIKKYSNVLKIKHSFHPNTSTGHVSAQLVKEIETKYSSCLPDDDLIITSAINPAIDYLNKNENISGVNGKSLLFITKNNSVFSQITWTRKNCLANLKNDKPIIRLKNLFSNILNCNTCILRTKNQKKVFNEVSKLDSFHSTFIFEELIGCVVMSLQGKIVQLPELFLCRQGHKDQTYHKFNIFDWLTHKNWQSSYFILEQLAVNEISYSEDLTKDDAKNIFREIFMNYLSKTINAESNRLSNELIINKKNTFNLIFQNNLKKILNKMIIRKNQFTLTNLLNKKSPYHNEFITIFNLSKLNNIVVDDKKI